MKDASSDLFRLVRQNPLDLSSRAVLADALTAEGDPRGTFISLQLLGGSEAKRRAATLLRNHLDAWLGPLEPFVVKKWVEFKNGFPSAAKLRVRTNEAAEAAARLEDWFSFEALVFERGSEASAARSFFSASMRSLQNVKGVERRELEQLARLSDLPPLVGLFGWVDRLDWLPIVERLERLEHLRLVDVKLDAATLGEIVRRLPKLGWLSLDAAQLPVDEARRVLERTTALHDVVLGDVTWTKRDEGWLAQGPGVR